jgi:membrane protease YdiL (CAAX protease family)
MGRSDSYTYRPVLFFALTYLATWIPWALAIYVGSQPELAPYAALFQFIGLGAPCAVALLLVLNSDNPALKRDFKDRLINPRRIRPLYLLAAILLPFAVLGLSIALSVLFGQSADQFRLTGGANLLPMIVLAMVLAPILEEAGWHGYGVDSLRAVAGMTKATLLFAVLWSAWHAPLAFIGGTYQHQLAAMDNKLFLVNFFVSIVPAAIIANWFYYKNDRSIVAAVLLHSGLNAASVLLNAGQVAKCIATVVFATVAAGLMIFDRTLFASGPANFLSDHAAAPRLGKRMLYDKARS